jgi:hypothetical protein
MMTQNQLLKFNKALAAFKNKKPDFPDNQPNQKNVEQAEEAEETVKPEKTFNDIFRKTVKKSY